MPTHYRQLSIVFALLAGSMVAGCTASLGPATTPTSAQAYQLAELRFDSPATQQTFIALDRCAREIAQAGGWCHLSYQQIGNFLEARWCGGAGARDDCQIAAGTADQRDQRVVSLSTLFYPNELPKVFGMSFSARMVPPRAGWGAQCWYSEGGRSVLGEGFDLQFAFYESTPIAPAQSLNLNAAPQYKVAETTVALPRPASLRAEFGRYLASAESMRDRGLEQLAALAEQVERTITAHAAQICEYGPSQGSLPPECTLRPLTPAEERAALDEAQAVFAAREQLLRERYKEMYAALLEAFPLDRCWR
jgi:hypothetical protein